MASVPSKRKRSAEEEEEDSQAPKRNQPSSSIDLVPPGLEAASQSSAPPTGRSRKSRPGAIITAATDDLYNQSNIVMTDRESAKKSEGQLCEEIEGQPKSGEAGFKKRQVKCSGCGIKISRNSLAAHIKQDCSNPPAALPEVRRPFLGNFEDIEGQPKKGENGFATRDIRCSSCKGVLSVRSRSKHGDCTTKQGKKPNAPSVDSTQDGPENDTSAKSKPKQKPKKKPKQKGAKSILERVEEVIAAFPNLRDTAQASYTPLHRVLENNLAALFSPPRDTILRFSSVGTDKLEAGDVKTYVVKIKDNDTTSSGSMGTFDFKMWDIDETLVSKVSELVVNCYNSFAQENPTAPPPRCPKFQTSLLNWAVWHLDHQNPLPIPVPSVLSGGVEVKIPYIDKDTGSLAYFKAEHMTGRNPSGFDATFPGVPSVNVWHEGQIQSLCSIPSGFDALPSGYRERHARKDWKEKSDEDLLQELRNAETLARYKSAKMSWIVANAKDMLRISSSISFRYVKQEGFGEDVISKSDLVTVARGFGPSMQIRVHRSSAIRPALGVALDVHLPEISLSSRDAAWWWPILEQAEACASDTHNAIDGWKQVARGVQDANLQIRLGLSPPVDCTCDTPEMKEGTAHPCGGCRRRCKCSERTLDVFGRWICHECVARMEKNPLVPSVLRRSLAGSIKREWKSKYGDDKVMPDRILTDAMEWVNDQLKDCQTTSFKDAYANDMMRQIGSIAAVPTVDACNPNWITDDGLNFNHDTANIEIILHVVNLAKYTHPVAILHEIGKHYQATRDAPNKALNLKLLERSHEISAIRIKHACLDSRRETDAKPTAAEIAARRRELQTGALDNVDKTEWLQLADRLTYAHQETSCKWTDEEMDDIVNIFQEIANKFQGGVLGTSNEDGAPWFNPDEPMPEDWSWDKLWSFTNARWTRMRYSCNRYWQMQDTRMGLICEIFHQLCDPEHKDFLGLPRTAKSHNPCMISVGKTVAGTAMKAGWPAHPKSLADRDPEQVTIHVETTFSNFYKYCWPVEHYPRLRTIMMEVEIPDRRYAFGVAQVASVPTAIPPDEFAEWDPSSMNNDFTMAAPGEDDEQDVVLTKGNDAVVQGETVKDDEVVPKDLTTRISVLKGRMLGNEIARGIFKFDFSVVEQLKILQDCASMGQEADKEKFDQVEKALYELLGLEDE